jgi:Uma2 family endonuclease
MAVTVRFAELPAGVEMSRPLTPDEFFDFCAANPELRVELSPEGSIHFMPPYGLESDDASAEVFYQLAAWAKADGRGRANGSKRRLHFAGWFGLISRCVVDPEFQAQRDPAGATAPVP